MIVRVYSQSQVIYPCKVQLWTSTLQQADRAEHQREQSTSPAPHCAWVRLALLARRRADQRSARVDGRFAQRLGEGPVGAVAAGAAVDDLGVERVGEHLALLRAA
jgi:hypothetical protein